MLPPELHTPINEAGDCIVPKEVCVVYCKFLVSAFIHIKPAEPVKEPVNEDSIKGGISVEPEIASEPELSSDPDMVVDWSDAMNYISICYKY
tara:strand:- start:228 stop:503 length:276 start_codon:yes stop_codon:yes gene_type:complete